jgi:hypothetical protein
MNSLISHLWGIIPEKSIITDIEKMHPDYFKDDVYLLNFVELIPDKTMEDVITFDRGDKQVHVSYNFQYKKGDLPLQIEADLIQRLPYLKILEG